VVLVVSILVEVEPDQVFQLQRRPSNRVLFELLNVRHRIDDVHAGTVCGTHLQHRRYKARRRSGGTIQPSGRASAFFAAGLARVVVALVMRVFRGKGGPQRARLGCVLRRACQAWLYGADVAFTAAGLPFTTPPPPRPPTLGTSSEAGALTASSKGWKEMAQWVKGRRL
jgi:hypothetical protein